MGYILALTAIFFWSWNIVIAAGFATSLDPLVVACGRWTIAALILLPMTWKKIVASRHILLAHFPLILGLSLTGIVLDNTLIYFAGHTASAVNIGMLDTTGPIFLLVLARVFLKIPISRQQFIGLIVAVIGVITIILQGDFTQLSQIKLVNGDFFVLANTLGFAIYSMLQSKRPPEIEQTTMLGVTVLCGVPILMLSVFSTVSLPRLEAFDMEDLAVICYLGIFNSVISYLAWNTALNKIGTIKAGIIYYMLPVFSAIEAHFVLHEQIISSQILGGIIVVTGIVLVNLHKRAPKTNPQTTQG